MKYLLLFLISFSCFGAMQTDKLEVTTSATIPNVSGSVTVTGTLTATKLVGDGSGIINLPGGFTDHGALTGLDDVTDHAWAALTNGTRNFTGPQTFEKAITVTASVTADTYSFDRKTDKYNLFMLSNNANTATLVNGVYNTMIGGYPNNIKMRNGESNVAFGYRAGEAINDGIANTLFGNSAGESLTSGQFNIGFGHQAGTHITTGNRNICVGTSSCSNTTTGEQNTAIGFAAGGSGNYSRRTTLGYYAGRYANENDAFVIDNRDRGSNAAEKTNALMYGTIASAPADSLLKINAGTTITGAATMSSTLNVGGNIFLNGDSGAENEYIKITAGIPAWSALPTANYLTNGIVTGVDYGKHDSKVPNGFGYRNAEGGIYNNWDTSLLTNATFGVNTSTPLNGSYDFALVIQTGTLTGEYLCTTDIPVPRRSRGQPLKVDFAYSYNGNNTDIYALFIDSTNTVTLRSGYLEGGSSKRKVLQGVSSSTTENVRLCFSVDVVNAGKILYLDDLDFSQDYDPQSCYFKHVLTSGTAGGTFTQDGWRKRPINVVNETGSTTSSSCPFASLSSDQVSLNTGKYNISVKAVASAVGKRVLRLNNTTLSSVVAYSPVNNLVTSNASNFEASLNAAVTLNSIPSTFEVQDYCTTTNADDGFGVAMNAASIPEIYLDMVITKLK